MNTAARNGYLSVVQFLHEHRTEGCTNPVMNKATKFGHLEIVKFLHKNRTEGCTYEAIDEASSNGHVEIVRYLVEQVNAPYSQYAVEWAASRGHLEVLQYFHEHIPLLSPREWIRYEATTFAMDEAAARDFLDIVRFLDENRSEGCTTNAMDKAAENHHLDVAKYLHEHRSEGYTTAAMDAWTCYNSSTKIAKKAVYVHEHQVTGILVGALVLAVYHGGQTVLAYLYEQCLPGEMTDTPQVVLRATEEAARHKQHIYRIVLGSLSVSGVISSPHVIQSWLRKIVKSDPPLPRR